MTPSRESLERLAAELPELDFASLADQREWLATDLVQSYLDHYRINFISEGLCQQHNLGKFLAAGFEVAVHVWQPAKARGTVFLLHGFTDSVGLMQHPIRFFLQQGWAVVAFDLPGHGLSSGEPASIDSFDQYRDVLTVCLRHCRHALPRPWRGVGQSTGAAVWMNYLATYPTEREVGHVLLAAPLVRPAGWANLRLLFPAYKGMSDSIPRKFRANSHDRAFLKFVKNKDPLQVRATPTRWVKAMAAWIETFSDFPVFQKALTIIQGNEDETVDFLFNLPLICEKFPGSALIMLGGARHQLFNESEQIRAVLFSHLRRWLEQPGEPTN